MIPFDAPRNTPCLLFRLAQLWRSKFENPWFCVCAIIFRFFFRNLGKKLISQQDRLLESQRSETILHCLDVDRVSWSQIYDWISSSRLIMMKWHAKATADVHQFQGARPHAGKVQKVCTSKRIDTHKPLKRPVLYTCLSILLLVHTFGTLPAWGRAPWNWCTSAVALACTSSWLNAKTISNH